MMDRGLIWERTVQLVNEHPLTGWGIGTYKVIFPALSGDLTAKGIGFTKDFWVWEYEGTKGNWMAWRQAHNVWAQILFEMGNIGLALFLGLIGYLVWLFALVKKTAQTVLAFSGFTMIMTSMLVYFPDRMIQCVPILLCYMAFYEIKMKEVS